MTSPNPSPAGTLTPTRREWEVTEWREKLVKAAGYRLGADGGAVPFGNTGVLARPILTAREVDTKVAAGDLIPTAVSALPPLLREVQRFRAVSEYVVGDAACIEGDCDHRDDNDNPTGECVTYLVVATADEAIRLHMIRRLLDAYLADGATAGHPDELGDLRRLVAEIHDVFPPAAPTAPAAA